MLPGPGRAPEPQQCPGVGLARSQESGGSLGPLAGPDSRGLPGADSRWGWGLGLVAAGAEVPRGRGRALLEQDRLRFPRHRLTHSLAAAQAVGIAPKEVAARSLRLDAPPPTSLQSSGVDPWGLRARTSWLAHVCLSREEHGWGVGGGGHACRFGPCTYVQERLCVRGGRLCVSLLGCTCVAEPRRERSGDTRKPGVSVGHQFIVKSACGPQARWSWAGLVEGNLVVVHPETLSLKLGSVGCPVLDVWKAQSLSWQRVLEDLTLLELREY